MNSKVTYKLNGSVYRFDQFLWLTNNLVDFLHSTMNIQAYRLSDMMRVNIKKNDNIRNLFRRLKRRMLTQQPAHQLDNALSLPGGKKQSTTK